MLNAGGSKDFLVDVNPELRRATPLTISETMIILEKARTDYTNDRRTEPPAFTQFYEHCAHFSKYKTETSTRDARAALSKMNIPEPYQVYLCDLQPGTAEEAKALVPALRRMPDDEVKPFLDELAAHASKGPDVME